MQLVMFASVIFPLARRQPSFASCLGSGIVTVVADTVSVVYLVLFYNEFFKKLDAVLL